MGYTRSQTSVQHAATKSANKGRVSLADDHDPGWVPTTGDLRYRHILGPSPKFDWRRLRAIAGPAR
jgi:hypothetical protein